jgi:hypothetical protein
VGLAPFQHLGGNALFELGHGADAMTAAVAIDHGVIGKTFFKVEVIFPALRAVEFYFHATVRKPGAAR